MERFMPKVGEMVKVEMYLNVTKIEKNAISGEIDINGRVKISSTEDVYVVGVPLVCCEAFKPEHDYEKSKANQD